MKRDWDVIREVLIEVEGVSVGARSRFSYATDPAKDEAANAKANHAILLSSAGFLSGSCTKFLQGKQLLLAPSLTWSGHELLDTLRSRPVWEKIKSTAQEKGIELTFDTVIALGKAAVALLVGQASG